MSDDSHLNESDKRIKRLLADTIAPESQSVIEAMRKLESEVRHQYDPDQWGGHFTPFEAFPVKLNKLSKEDIMVKLRARLNKGYMPTSTRPGVTYNSKPQYLDGVGFGSPRDYSLKEHPTFPAPHYFDGYGTASWVRGVKNETMYAFYGTNKMEFLTNLETEETLVRNSSANDRKWYNWDSEEFKGKEVAVNPYDLDECLDTYM